MRTIKVELPIEEALEVIRLLRAESRCLIENGDVLTDLDVVKRAQIALSARERIVSSLEVFAEEQPPKVKHPTVGPMYHRADYNAYRSIPNPKEEDWLMEQGTTLPEDRLPLSVQHGGGKVNGGGTG